jgi:hypothetical protein
METKQISDRAWGRGDNMYECLVRYGVILGEGNALKLARSGACTTLRMSKCYGTSQIFQN